MKKIIYLCMLLIVAITVYVSCDTRKFRNEATPQPTILVDSISFKVVKTDADTIRTYNKRSASYTLTLTAFDANKIEIKNAKIPTSISYIQQTGVNKIDLKQILSDTNLVTNKTYSLDYFPAATINANNAFVFNCKNTIGKIFKDTVKYYVFKYDPVAFSITATPNSIPFLRPSSTFDFKVNVDSKDKSNQMKYKIKFELANEEIKIYDSQNKLIGNPNDMILLLGDNKFTAKLVNHIAGSNYNVRVIVYDENGDEQSTILSYTVKYNEAPIIEQFSFQWDTIYNNIENVASPPQAMKPGPISSQTGLSCFNYDFIEFGFILKLNLKLNYSDDIEAKQILITSSRGYSKTINLYNNSTSNNTIIDNGTIFFRYPSSDNGHCYIDNMPSKETINLFSQWATVRYYDFYYGWIFGNGGLTNNGTNITTANPTVIFQKDIISVFVLDGEGGKSIAQTFSVNINEIKGTTKWHPPTGLR